MERRTARRRGAAAAAGAVVLVTVAAAGPAEAADTTTTFTLAGGTLSLSAPGSADLGEGDTGDLTLQGSLGSVTVTDNRGLLAATWTVTASATDFTTGTETAAETIDAANVTYTPGAPTSSSPATGVFTPTPGVIGTALPVYAGVAVGNNTATWNPTITIALPPQAVVGEYSGIVTHSVS